MLSGGRSGRGVGSSGATTSAPSAEEGEALERPRPLVVAAGPASPQPVLAGRGCADAPVLAVPGPVEAPLADLDPEAFFGEGEDEGWGTLAGCGVAAAVEMAPQCFDRSESVSACSELARSRQRRRARQTSLGFSSLFKDAIESCIAHA